MEQGSNEAKSGLNERRRFARADIYAVTRYFCLSRNKEVGVQTRISDISEGGVRPVTFMEGIPVETPVKMSFIIPGDGKGLITVEGKVRHTGPFEKDLYRSGVEFTQIKEKDVLSIREYVATRRKK